MKILISFLALLCSLSVYSQTNIPEGPVTGRWERQYSPYVVKGDVTIPVGGSLIIEAGVRVMVDPDCKIAVLGSLVAEGSRNDSILFTRNGEGRWNGIRFDNKDVTQDSSKLKYCTVEYSTPGIGDWYGGGGIYIDAPKVLISNCRVRRNKAQYGGGIACLSGAKIINTEIVRNEAEQTAGGVYIDGQATLVGCVIAFNTAYGYPAFEASQYPLLMNCNICYNTTLSTEPWAVTMGGNFRLHNSIVWHNNPGNMNLYVNGANIAPEFRFCNIQGGIKSIFPNYANIAGLFWGVYEDCIDFDPGFLDGANGDFRLGVSYCIDAGDPASDVSDYPRDIMGNERIFAGLSPRIDIGAYEYAGPTPDRVPYIIAQDTILILKNRPKLLHFPFIEGDENDEYHVTAYSDNANVDVSVDAVSDSSFSLTVTPAPNWSGIAMLIKQISNSASTGASFYRDTTYLVVNNYFKGVVSDVTAMYDTIRVVGDIWIQKGGTLNVEAGTFVQFQGPYQISVLGSLNVLGTDAKRVKFDAVDTLTMIINELRFDKGWTGIRFFDSDTSHSTIQYCNIRNIGVPAYYAGNYPPDFTFRYHQIEIIDYDNVTFDHCLFESNFNHITEKKSSSAIYSKSSDNINLSNCVFKNSFVNEVGASCIWAESSTVNINKCIVKDQKSEVWGNSRSNSFCVASDNSIISINQSDFIGNEGSAVIASFDNKYLKIENCSFLDNDTQVMEIIFSDATIINNKFINNGMAINIRGKANIIGNLIAHSKVFCGCSNFFGTAINMFIADSSIIANNTIVENEQDSYGAAIYYSSTSAVAIVNNLFWHNSNLVSDNANINGYNGVDGDYADPFIKYNLVNGDPLFRMNDTLDFELTRLSPCINKGSRDTTGLGLGEHDLAGNIRVDPYHKIVDIGAYEYSLEDMPNAPPGQFTITNPINNQTISFINRKLEISSSPSEDPDHIELTKKYFLTGSDIDTIMIKSNNESIFIDSTRLKAAAWYNVEAEVSDGIAVTKASNVVTFMTPALTGLEDLRQKNFQLYPIPVTDYLNLQFQSEFRGIIIVYNIDGKIVDYIQTEGNNVEIIDMSKYNPGIYIVSISDCCTNSNYRIIKN
jgi:hypothetical protein